MDTGAWTHIAVTFQSGVTNGTRVYINGVLVLTSTITVANQSSGFGIGALPDGQYYAGTIDEVAFYKRVLPASELALRYAAGLKQPR